jgi:hypothetical protein
MAQAQAAQRCSGDGSRLLDKVTGLVPAIRFYDPRQIPVNVLTCARPRRRTGGLISWLDVMRADDLPVTRA